MVSLFFHWFVVFYKSIKNKNWTQMALLFCRFFFLLHPHAPHTFTYKIELEHDCISSSFGGITFHAFHKREVEGNL